MLAVSDTGVGMDSAVQAHIFDPFFTTKPVGMGTGLGLATVYGVVKQSGGFILVESEAGRGTRFEIYLPRVEGIAESIGPAKEPAEISGGTETILIAEDAVSLRLYLIEVLGELGYRVLAARDGTEALRLVEHETGPIDLLLTDVIMPSTSGPDLASRVQALRPGIKVIYMSGYTDGRLGNNPDFNSQFFLQKPFQLEDLAQKIRSALKSAREQGDAMKTDSPYGSRANH
jgi:CheY-like chemotaxis protein